MGQVPPKAKKSNNFFDANCL